jgi:hypothetical protein
VLLVFSRKQVLEVAPQVLEVAPHHLEVILALVVNLAFSEVLLQKKKEELLVAPMMEMVR